MSMKRHPKLSLTDDIMVAITEDLVAGVSLTQACADRQLPYQTTRLAMLRAGMPVGRGLMQVCNRTARAAELWNSGLNLASVGEALGITKQGAGSALRTAAKYGLVTRPLGYQTRNKGE